MTHACTFTTFNFNGTQIHAFADDRGDPWFAADDVCAVLGYSNVSEAVSDYCRVKGIKQIASLTKNDSQEFTYINEGNLYRLIINSRAEATHNFEISMTDEIIPAIRKSEGHTSSQAECFISSNQQSALQQIVSQRAGDSDVVSTEIRNRFSEHFKVGSFDQLTEERFVDAVAFLASIPTHETQPGARYQYPRALFNQPYFVAPRSDHACLSLSMLSNLAQFKSPLMSLLNQLRNEGHDVSAPLDEAIAMRMAMRQTNKVLDEIRIIALKAKSGRLG